MNISNFITWFLSQFYSIGANLLSKLDNIILHGNISLMDFIITIAILSMFLPIILTIPNNMSSRVKRTGKREKEAKND